MKNILNFSGIFMIGIMALLASCSKSDGPKSDAKIQPAVGTWIFADQTFTKVLSTQDMEEAPGSGSDFKDIILTTAASGSLNGDFSGSALAIVLPKGLGEGSYDLVESVIFSPKGRKVMRITCVVGIAAPRGSTGYTTSEELGGRAQLTIDSKGLYHIGLQEPVSLKKYSVVEGGVPGAKDTYTLNFTDLY